MNPQLAKRRVALVHDDLVQGNRGGEKVFLAIAELFPAADIYTSMATKEWEVLFRGRKVRLSFMQILPFKEKLQRFYFPLYPLAFESFDFSHYDLVISSSSRFAFGVITKPETIHLSYIHHPGRMFWEAENYLGADSKLKTLLSPALSYLRLWGFTAAQRVDYFLANSINIAGKIERYFGRKSEVVYPFVDLEKFESPPAIKPGSSAFSERDYFLVVTRLGRWKRVDLAIEVARRLGIRLKIVGEGPERRGLENLAGGGYNSSRARIASDSSRVQIEFMGAVSDGELAELYKNCTAFIMTQEEDFGIAPLEAQASGRPVIAYGAGGALETVVPGQTGEFFRPQTATALVGVLKSFKVGNYNPEKCRKNAARFSKQRFQDELMKQLVKACST